MATGTVGETAYTQLSPLDDPRFASLFQQAQGAIPGSVPGLEGLIQGGINSPLLQAILGPALERLRVPQAQQRQQFTESARSAGGLRGSQYGQGMNQLMQNQGLQANDLMSQVIAQVLQTLVSGQLQSQQNQFLPAQAQANLLGRIQPQTVLDRMGGGVGGGGGIIGAGRSLTDNSVGNYGAGNYAPGNAITTPGVGAAYGGSTSSGTGFGGASNSLFAPTQPAPQYVDPWASVGNYQSGNYQSGNYGGGSYDVGNGQQWLGNPDPFAGQFADLSEMGW